MAMGAVRWSADGGYVGLAQRNPTISSVEHGVVQVVAGGGGAVGGKGWGRGSAKTALQIPSSVWQVFIRKPTIMRELKIRKDQGLSSPWRFTFQSLVIVVLD